MNKINQDVTKICPEICLRCKCYLEFILTYNEITDDNEILNEIHCVDARECGPIGQHKIIANPVPIFENVFKKDKDIFIQCYKDVYKESFFIGTKKIILKPSNITDELKQAFSNLIVNKHECPYYFEHKINEWSKDEH